MIVIVIVVIKDADERIDSGEAKRGSEVPRGVEDAGEAESGGGGEEEAVGANEARAGAWFLGGREVEPRVGGGVKGERLVVPRRSVVKAKEKEPRVWVCVGVVGDEGRERRSRNDGAPRFADRRGPNESWDWEKGENMFGYVGAQGCEVGVRVVV